MPALREANYQQRRERNQQGPGNDRNWSSSDLRDHQRPDRQLGKGQPTCDQIWHTETIGLRPPLRHCRNLGDAGQDEHNPEQHAGNDDH